MAKNQGLEGAICRLWTATGWANVCRSHYSKVETVPRRSESLTVREIREAYLKSAHARRGGSIPPAQVIGELLPREPGDDREDLALGIERDPLEQEFMDLAQP